MVERRDALRQKSLLRGIVYFNGGNCAVECIVRDVSETGARLKFQRPPTAANVLDLHIPNKGQRLRANVRWHQNDEIGVAFESTLISSESALVSSVPQLSAAAVPTADNGDLAKRVQHLEAEIVALRRLVKRLQQKISDENEAA